jgi:drug/metabolite transporter (DMT)-like permease
MHERVMDVPDGGAHTGRVPRPSRSAVAALAVTVVAWAAAFPAIRVALPGLGAAGLSVARLAVASLALAVAAPFVGVRRPAARDLPLIALCGLTGMTAYQLLLNSGEEVVPAGTASLLIATAPIYSVVIASLVLGERPTRRQLLGGSVAFAGVALIALSRGGVEFRSAALLVLAAAVVQGTYHAVHKPLLARYTSFEVTSYAMWAGTLFVLPWAGQLVGRLPDAGLDGIGGALFLGIVPSAVGFVTWAHAVGRVDMSVAATSLYLVPVVAIALAFAWLGEVPGAVELVGGAIAVGGVVLANRVRRRPPAPAPLDLEPAPAC